VLTEHLLGGRGPKLWLLAIIDDARRRALARFVRHDTTEENLGLVGTYLMCRDALFESNLGTMTVVCTVVDIPF